MQILENTTLLVIDMQLVAFDGKITPAITSGDRLLGNISTLIDVCRSMGVTVMFTQACAPPGKPYAVDSHGWEIHPALTPVSSEQIISKVGPSAFENAEFEKSLTSLGTTDIIVCGNWSESCVSITCRGALKRGYNITLAADGHGTVRTSEDEANTIIEEQNELLARRGADVISIKDISRTLRA